MAFVVNITNNDKQFLQRTEAVNEYFNQIRKFPILTAKEERKLLTIVKLGNEQEAKEARDRLINCNQRFVVSAARQWQNDGNLMDIIFEGTIGLIKAIDNFDLSKEQRFLTYAAFWIRKTIKEYIQTTERLIRPINANKIQTYANKARESFFKKYERYPNTDELQEELWSVYKVRVPDKSDLEIIEISRMDKPEHVMDNDPSMSVFNTIEMATATNNIKDDINKSYVNDMVTAMLDILDDRERNIVKAVYGIDADCEESFDIIALRMDLTKERVRQLYKQAINKIKANFRNKQAC